MAPSSADRPAPLGLTGAPEAGDRGTFGGAEPSRITYGFEL